MSKTVKKKVQNSTLWDDFWRFVKQNEKVFWVVLLVLISFSFAFPTGAVFQSLGRQYPKLQVFGETVYDADYKAAGNDLGDIWEMRIQTSQVLNTAGLRDEIPPGWSTVNFTVRDPLSMVEYFLYLKEADRLGIFISDAELGDEVLLHYHAARALDEARRTPTAEATGQLDRDALGTGLKALRASGEFDVDEWSRLLREKRVPSLQGFERALRRILRAARVVEYVRSSVQVSEDEVWERFLTEEELRKVSFFKVEDDGTLRDKITAEITDAILREHYKENVDKFKVQSWAPKLSATYLYIPYDSLKDQIEPTEEDLDEHYRKMRDSKYLKPLDVDTTSFELLTAEQEQEREKQMYVPLEEVREEVLDGYIETETKSRARELGLELRKQLFAAPGVDVDTGEVVKKLLEEHSFLETGTTSFFSRYEVEDEAAKVNSSLLTSWFTNLGERDPTKKRPVEISRRFSETQDKKGMVLYTEVETLESGQETFEKLTDQVREDLVKIEVVEGLESRAKTVLERIEKGELTLAKAAEEFDSRLLESSYQKRTGQIYVPVEEEPEEDAEDEKDDGAEEEGSDNEGSDNEDGDNEDGDNEDGDNEDGDNEDGDDEDGEEDDRPKTEYLRASRVILQKAFALSEGEVASVVDENDGVAYIVRLDGRVSPAPQDFDENQKSRQRATLLAERENAYFVNWRNDLWTRGEVKEYRDTKDRQDYDIGEEDTGEGDTGEV